jgi:hypothetical protein
MTASFFEKRKIHDQTNAMKAGKLCFYIQVKSIEEGSQHSHTRLPLVYHIRCVCVHI